MNRRALLTALSTIPALGWIAPATASPTKSGVRNFSDLKKWVDSLPVKQVDGTPTAICGETGEKYTVRLFGGLARPGTEHLLEESLAVQMQNAISKAIEYAIPYDMENGKWATPNNNVRPKSAKIEDVTIYWRERLESGRDNYPVVTAYSEDGPDFDFLTDRRCMMDREWRKIGIYCRFTVDCKVAS